MKDAFRGLVLLAMLLVLGTATSFAQFLSGIEGTVKDSAGATVSGAKVTITDNRLQVVRNTTTNDAGYFRVDSIAESVYTVRIEMTGFKIWEQKDLAVEPGKLRTIAPVIPVGSISEQVTVSAEANAVNVATAGTTSVIAAETVESTPLTGRNVYGVAPLTPGITGAEVAEGTVDNFTNEYAININAAGLRQEQNGFSIDGAQTNTPSRAGGTSISPNPSIVQSVEVRTNDFDAQKGRNGGAVVDVYTKSGTDQLRGSVDYLFWNNNFVLATHFLNPVPTFTHKDVSAAVGGPAIKGKLFWFGAIEVLRSNQTGSGTTLVETQDLLDWMKNPASGLQNTVALQTFNLAPPAHYPTGGFVTASQIEASGNSYFAPPVGIDPNLNVLGSITYGTSSPKNGYQWSGRADY